MNIVRESTPIEQMIRQQIMERGIRDERVLTALRRTPRERFVLEDQKAAAYADKAIPIGHGQTISQPYIVALMTFRLDVQADHKVLEIGTGSGYQTAVLAQLAKEVCTIERLKPLLDASFHRLHELKLKNIKFRFGDGSGGWPEQAPFDRLLITAGAPQLPRPLLISHLKDGGMAIMPIGSREEQTLIGVRRRGDDLLTQEIIPCRFVPLIGEQGWPADDKT